MTLSSAKNCDKVIPKAPHMASKVGSVGELFLLYLSKMHKLCHIKLVYAYNLILEVYFDL